MDPLSLDANLQEGVVFQAQRDYDKAIARLQKTLEIDPNFGLAYNYLARCYEAKGMYDKSMDAEERLLTLFGQPEAAAELKKVYATSGMKGVHQRSIRRIATPPSPGTTPPSSRELCPSGGQGQVSPWLEKAYQQRAAN